MTEDQIICEMKDHMRRALAAQCQRFAAFDALEAQRLALWQAEYARSLACERQELAAEAYRLARQVAGVES